MPDTAAFWDKIADKYAKKPVKDVESYNRAPSQSSNVQTKMEVSQPDDPEEKEADQVAQAVSRMPNHSGNDPPRGRATRGSGPGRLSRTS